MRSARIPVGVVAALAAVTALGPAPAFAASPQPAVAVSPAPGTPDASPLTQISILGVPEHRIASVAVRGSLSGPHPGVLRAYSGDRGASFVLAKPLTQGEQVSVRVGITRHPPVAWSFTVARLAPTPPIINLNKLQPAKLQHFVADPALLPPRITVHKGRLNGDVFLTPLPSPIVHPGSKNAVSITPVGPAGPMIIDGHGRLVWFHQLAAPLAAANLRLQQLHGKTVLTWWQGVVTIAAYGLGEGIIYDSSYRPLKVVRTGNGYSADIHEFKLTAAGDALFTVDSLVLLHLPGSAPGKLSPFLDSIVQQVDVRTGLVMWEWHSLGHIPLADSYANEVNSPYYDAYHLNSIEPLAGGRLLVSARDTSAVYEIDQTTGRIVWTLGGLASSFRLGPGARFYFQHDAQLLAGNRVSLFDDQGGPPFFAKSSRGLILALDQRHHTATLAHQYTLRGALADSEGSFQTLPGGDAFVGFGSEPPFAEFTPAGRLEFEASLPADDGSYRVFSAPWTATPTARPTVAAKRSSPSRVSVYASWNGATTVARWRVLAGASPASLKPVACAAARGFETRVTVSSRARVFEVRALASNGRVLGRSAAVSAS
jgi:Arylsulfotransferase (ASST)